MTPDRDMPGQNASAEEQAAQFAARKRLGLMSCRDEEALRVWLADPANALAWQRQEALLDGLLSVASLPEVRELRRTALALRRPKSFALRWFGYLTAAASVVAVLALYPASRQMSESAFATKSAARRYVTKIGEQRQILLADGSRVDLNTGTTLEVDLQARQRNLRLIQGQALFKVARDSARPFIVTAGTRRIVATGTAFDVRVARGGATTVVLLEGHVSVAPIRPQGLARIFPTLAADKLEPGEMIEAAAQGEATVALADLEQQTSWTRGQLIFRDDRLADAIEEVNRYSTSRIVIDDPRVADLRVSGVFRYDRTDNFVSALTALYPLTIDRTPSGVIIMGWQANGDTSSGK